MLELKRSLLKAVVLVGMHYGSFGVSGEQINLQTLAFQVSSKPTSLQLQEGKTSTFQVSSKPHTRNFENLEGFGPTFCRPGRPHRSIASPAHTSTSTHRHRSPPHDFIHSSLVSQTQAKAIIPTQSHVRHVRATSPPRPRRRPYSIANEITGWFRGPTMGTLIRPGPAASPLPIASPSSSSAHGIADSLLCRPARPSLRGEATPRR